jgi:hypothetical protein
MFVSVSSNWRDGFEFASIRRDLERRGPRPYRRQLDARRRSGTWDSKIWGTVTADSGGWVAYLRLEDPPGLSPITTVRPMPWRTNTPGDLSNT